MYFTYGWLSYKRNKGIFNNQNSPPDRWHKIKEEFDISIKDFHVEGDNILLILQRPEDSSIHDIVSLVQQLVWLCRKNDSVNTKVFR